MKKKNTYWLIAVISVLLISLLANQLIYVYQAAVQQEAYFNDKANVALESIVNSVSKDYDVCQSVSKHLDCGTSNACSTVLKPEQEWKNVDSIIKAELKAVHIDLNYNFNFCSSHANQLKDLDKKNAYSKDMDKALSKSGIIMYLEFPSKSNYLYKQMGPVFISSILIILLISIVFIITFRFYRKEKQNAERTRGFLNNMTHEFKTPLANIAFANNLLKRNQNKITPEKIKTYTQIIQAENENMMASSEDILEMAKHEYDFTKISLENVDIHDIIYDLQKSFKQTYSVSNLNISLNLKASLYSVKGKTSFLRHAISNLIDNAIKYCEQTPSIIISTENEKGKLLISVTDNGIGIPKKEMNSIFDKFYRIPTGDRHDVKGFGLGLAYVKMVAEQMKGSVSVKSSLGKGSIFTIKLPITHV